MLLAPQTPSILATCITQTIDNGLADLTHIVVIHADDSDDAIAQAIGGSPLEHPIDGYRYDDARFEPYWDWLKDHGGWFELTHCVANSGFAFVLLIEDAGDTDLVRMCRRYT